MLVAVAAVVPVVSALIAGIVAWAVTRRQGRTARESWVLDRRYGVYEKIIEAATGLLGSSVPEERRTDITDPVKVRQFRQALIGLDLIAPNHIRRAADHLWDMTSRGGFENPTKAEELRVTVNALMSQLREDLVPDHMR